MGCGRVIDDDKTVSSPAGEERMCLLGAASVGTEVDEITKVVAEGSSRKEEWSLVVPSGRRSAGLGKVL